MNKNQFNVITELQSGISTIYKSKLDEIKEEFETELKLVFEKLEEKLNSL